MFRTVPKCIILDGTGKRGQEKLGMLISATVNADSAQCCIQFLDLVTVRNKAGSIEATALSDVFVNRDWHLSTLYFLTMDSASTNETLLNCLIEKKKKVCIPSPQNEFHLIESFPSDIPKKVHFTNCKRLGDCWFCNQYK